MTESELQEHARIFENAAGPTPWYTRPGSPAVNGFEWRQTNKEWPGNYKTLLLSPAGVAAIFDFYNWVMRIDDATLLIWNEHRSKFPGQSPPVQLFLMRPSLLEPFPYNFPIKKLEERFQSSTTKFKVFGEPLVPFTLNTFTIEEDLPATFPPELQHLDEILILCHSSAAQALPKMRADLALLVARPKQGTFRLYPQEWFNASNLDFGYQWVTRVARNPATGHIHGEGFRIDPFVLDETLCNLRKSV